MARETQPPRHVHTASCYSRKVVCGKAVHAHSSGCYHRASGTLTCGQSPHQHGGECMLRTLDCNQ